MKIEFIGLGKMGFNMVHRLIADGHEVVVWNRDMVSALSSKIALMFSPIGVEEN